MSVLAAAELPGSKERGPGNVPQPLAIVGPFQPAALAKLLAPEAASRLAGLQNFAGVPVNWLAGALAGQGIPATVIGGVRGAEPRWIQGDPLSVVVYQSSGGWPFLLNGRSLDRAAILKTLREVQPELVHAHWTFEAGRAVADWKGPKVLTVHDAAWEYARLGWSAHPISMTFAARWLLNTRQTLAGFDHLIAVSPYLESYLRLKHGFRGEIRVIPNAIVELPADLVVPQVFPKSGQVTFATFGEPGRLKNVPSAIEAFRRLARSMPDIRLIVFGSRWEGLKKELDGLEQIEFPGALPHHEFLRALVEQVDVWVHPSRMETHGIVICEAIQAGCPVIAGRNSGAVPWTLCYGRAGLLVDVEDPEELREAMETAIVDRRRSESLVAHGRQQIQAEFNPERILALHLEYYRDILACRY